MLISALIGLSNSGAEHRFVVLSSVLIFSMVRLRGAFRKKVSSAGCTLVVLKGQKALENSFRSCLNLFIERFAAGEVLQ